MRRLLTVVAVVIAVAVAAAVLLVASLDRLLDANRDRIVAGMSDGFARPVTIGRIGAGFHGGVAVELHELAIGEDPAFGTEPFLTAAEAYAVVGIGPLLRGRIEVRRIAAVSPHVTIVRTARGLNVDSLGDRARVRRDATAEAKRPAAEAPGGIPAVAIALVNLEAASVRYLDRRGAIPSETTIAPLHLRLTDVSPTTPVGFGLRATVQGASATTLRVRGTVGPVGDPPFAADVPLEQHVTIAGGDVDVPDLVVAGRIRRDDAGRPVATVRVTAATVRAAGVAVSDLEITGTERDGTATLEALGLTVFGGTIAGKGYVAHGTHPRVVGFETAVRGVDVAAAVASRSPDVAGSMEGRLDADWSMTATGDDEAAVRRSLVGQGHVVVRDGGLLGVNVVERVFAGVSRIPGLANLVPRRLRDRYPEVFSSEDTRFDELTADVRVGDERVVIESLVVSARDYTLRGAGVVTFAGHVDLNLTLVASGRLTKEVVGALKAAELLTDDAGGLAIPFRLGGTLPNLRPKLDEELLGRVLRALGGERLERLLRDDKGKKRDTKKLLQKGIDELFGR